jgi:hypothetical protein
MFNYPTQIDKLSVLENELKRQHDQLDAFTFNSSEDNPTTTELYKMHLSIIENILLQIKELKND